MECFEMGTATLAARAATLVFAAGVQAGDVDALRSADAAGDEWMQSRAPEAIVSRYADDAVAELTEAAG